MKHTQCVLLAAIFTVTSPIVSFASETEDRVAEAYAAWDAAFNAADKQDLAALYTDDATLLPADHSVVNGATSIGDYFGGFFDAGVTDHSLEMITASEGSDLVVGAAKWSANGLDAEGNPTSFDGVATHVFAKQADGSLELMLHTFN